MLSVVATPIGNLGDLSPRALEALRSCAAIVCEDTRSTGQLLKHYNIEKKPFLSFHGYSDLARLDSFVARLQAGEHLCLVSDAGTPGISDPGNILVSRAADAGVRIEALPGPAAFLTALSVSGLPIHTFTYLGFLPLKKGRKTLINSFAQEERTIVFYESVHRIERTLLELATALAAEPDRRIVVARELTKMHEEVVRTTVAELPEAAKRMVKKGEFVVIVAGAR